VPADKKNWRGQQSKIYVMQTIFVMGSIELSRNVTQPVVNDHVAEHYIKLNVTWNHLPPEKKIQDAITKKADITAGSDFPLPWSPEFTSLTALGALITDANAKLLARSQKLPNSKRNLTASLKALYRGVTNIGMMIQLKMDTVVPTEAIRMCLAAGYTYKAINVRGKRPNCVKQTTTPGTVVVWGEGQGSRLWQMSPDPNHETITDLKATKGGVKTVDSLTSKKEVWFRWSLMLADEAYGEWCPWYSGIVP